jgi:hypothetical protein
MRPRQTRSEGLVLNRLQRAERLLPHPLADHGLEVGVALEIAQWLGTQPGSATP